MPKFENRRSLILLFSLILPLIGCSGDNPGGNNEKTLIQTTNSDDLPRVGLVDMQRLSDSLGISEQLAEKREDLQQEWSQVDSDTRGSITSALKEFGGDAENLTNDQKAELQKLQLDRRKKLDDITQKNNAAMQETSRWLSRVLSERTKGLIDAVGKDMGLDLILVRVPGQVAYIREGVDVTDKVLKRAGKSREKKNVEGEVPDIAPKREIDSSD